MERSIKIQRILAACVALFLFYGCSTRHKTVIKADSTAVTWTVKKTMRKHHDTGYYHERDSNYYHFKNDTGSFISITTDTGIVYVGANGSFTGKAKSITIHKRSSKQGSGSGITIKDSGHASGFQYDNAAIKKDSTINSKTIKIIDKKPNYILIIILAITGAISALLLYLKNKKEPPSGKQS